MKASTILLLCQLYITITLADDNCAVGVVGYELLSTSNPNLYPRQILQARNQEAYLAAQTDGNVVVYWNISGKPKDRWSADTWGKIYDRFTINFNGDVVQFTKPNSWDYINIWQNTNTPQSDVPFQMIMQDDGNLVVYSASGKVVWATNTPFAPSTTFSKVRFENDGRAVVTHPLVKDVYGDNDLWNPYTSGDSYWYMFDGDSRLVDFNTDTIKGSSQTIGDYIGGSGTQVALGLKVVAGDDDWINSLNNRRFIYDKSSTDCVKISKYGGLRDGDATFDAVC